MSTAEFSAESELPQRATGRRAARGRAGEPRPEHYRDRRSSSSSSPRQVEALEQATIERLPGPVVRARHWSATTRVCSSSIPRPLLEGCRPRATGAGAVARRARPSAEIPLSDRARGSNCVSLQSSRRAGVGRRSRCYEFYYFDTPRIAAIKTGQVERRRTSPPIRRRSRDTHRRAFCRRTAPAPMRRHPRPRRWKHLPPRVRRRPARQRGPASEVASPAFRASEAWVEIRDRSGRKIFSQINPPGTEHDGTRDAAAAHRSSATRARVERHPRRQAGRPRALTPRSNVARLTLE